MVKYFKVVMKCGHVGKKRYVPITFAVKAINGKDAAEKARLFPRVKHSQKYAVLDCERITYEEYVNIYKMNGQDEYLKCKNIQQQNLIDMSDRILDDPYYFEKLNKIRHIKTVDDILKRKERIEYRRKKEKCIISSFQLGGAY